MIASSCLEMPASMASMPAVMVRVRFLFQVTVPFSASSVSVLIRSCGAGPLGLLGGRDGLVEQAAFGDGRLGRLGLGCRFFGGTH